jgi:hypothetical protein
MFRNTDQPEILNRTHLKELLILCYNMSRGAFLLALPYVGGGLDDLTKLISEIVLASHRTTVHCDARPNWRRGNRQNGQNHPLRASIFVGEPKEMQVGIRYLHQSGIYFRRCKQPFILVNSFYILEHPSTYDAA